ncbi:MAG: hypothetical protein ACRC9V_01630, partial [Aeromonas sp.]
MELDVERCEKVAPEYVFLQGNSGVPAALLKREQTVVQTFFYPLLLQELSGEGEFRVAVFSHKYYGVLVFARERVCTGVTSVRCGVVVARLMSPF